MKKFAVTDLRWASARDFELPIWQEWNRKNPLPNGFWQRIWEYPYAVSRIPRSDLSLDIGGTYPFVLFKSFPNAKSVDIRDLNALDHRLHKGLWPAGKLIISDATAVPAEDDSFPHVFSISAVEEMPDPLAVLKEMVRLAKHRVLVTMDISEELGVSRAALRELEAFLGVRLPAVPRDVLTSTHPVLGRFKQRKRPIYEHIRVLGFTLDARDERPSVAILMPNTASWPLVEAGVNRILRHSSPELDEQVYIVDDGTDAGGRAKAQQLATQHPSIHVLTVEHRSERADTGRLFDQALPQIREQYVAMVDGATLPMSPEWLSFPVWLIQEYGCSAVGNDSGRSNRYLGHDKSQTWWQPKTGYRPEAGLYDNAYFTVIDDRYRLMPAATAKIASENVGFSKRGAGSLLRRLIPQTYVEGCESGVAANHFIDRNQLGPKFNLPVTGSLANAAGEFIGGLACHLDKGVALEVLDIESLEALTNNGRNQEQMSVIQGSLARFHSQTVSIES